MGEATDNTPKYVDASVNMLEVTNRLSISIDGLEGDLSNFSIDIEAGNGSMNHDGSIASGDVLRYERNITISEGVIYADFTILKLDTGFDNTLIITDTENDKEILRANLLGTLLLKNPNINLKCDHDFEVDFTAEDQCECGTYVITEVRINQWIIHSYDTEM